MIVERLRKGSIPVAAEAEPAGTAKPPRVRHRTVNAERSPTTIRIGARRLVELGSPNHVQDRLTDRPRTRCGCLPVELSITIAKTGSAIFADNVVEANRSERVQAIGRPAFAVGAYIMAAFGFASWTFSLFIESACMYSLRLVLA